MLKFQLVGNILSHISRRDQEFNALVSSLGLRQESQASFWRDWFRALSYGLCQCFPSVRALEPYCSAHSGYRVDEKAYFVHVVPTHLSKGCTSLDSRPIWNAWPSICQFSSAFAFGFSWSGRRSCSAFALTSSMR